MGPIAHVMSDTQFTAFQDASSIPTNGVNYQQFQPAYNQPPPPLFVSIPEEEHVTC